MPSVMGAQVYSPAMPTDLDYALELLEEERQLAMGAEARLYAAVSGHQLGLVLQRTAGDTYVCTTCELEIPEHETLTVGWIERTVREGSELVPAGVEHLAVAHAGECELPMLARVSGRAEAFQQSSPDSLAYTCRSASLAAGEGS